uniref:Uncharacterized protein n=1 Tax=Cacopsylla melanoneura TaxID=428564 RepID=A0A8D8Z0X2_9HEMI
MTFHLLSCVCFVIMVFHLLIKSIGLNMCFVCVHARFVYKHWKSADGGTDGLAATLQQFSTGAARQIKRSTTSLSLSNRFSAGLFSFLLFVGKVGTGTYLSFPSFNFFRSFTDVVVLLSLMLLCLMMLGYSFLVIR